MTDKWCTENPTSIVKGHQTLYVTQLLVVSVSVKFLFP